MWGGVKVKTKPIAPPLTADQLRIRCRLPETGDAADDAADAALLDDLCGAAVAMIDGPDGIGFAMMRQAWTLTVNGFAPVMFLPGAPIVTVDEIRYLDDVGAWVTVDPARYRAALGFDPVRIVPQGDGWPSVPAGQGMVQIDYSLGASDAAEVDMGLTTAVAMLVAHYFENREAVTIGGAAVEVPLGVQRALDRHRRGGVAG